MIKFEGYERRIDKLNNEMSKYNISSLEEAAEICRQYNIDVEKQVRSIQPIAFDNAVWAYTLGCAIALKKGSKTAAEAAEAIGLGLRLSVCLGVLRISAK